MKLSSKTHIGLQRTQNEDDFLVKKLHDGYFLLVCDGMGGANAGSIASAKAKEDIEIYIESHYSYDVDIEKMLVDAIKFTNNNIFNNANSIKEYNGMGTTIVIAFIYQNKVTIAHVGDSRGYIINKDSISLLTHDHSIVQALLDEGTISEVQARNHPQKNIITRAIGVNIDVDVDVKTIDLEDSDVLLLCTDGLTGFIEDSEIFDIINNNDFYKCAQLLIDKANENGGADNITVAIATRNKN